MTHKRDAETQTYLYMRELTLGYVQIVCGRSSEYSLNAARKTRDRQYPGCYIALMIPDEEEDDQAT